MTYIPDFGPEPPHATTTGTHRVHDSPWLSLRIDDIVQPSGARSDRRVAERPPSAVIIPVTADGHVLLVRQWRHAANRHLIELPAGLIDDGETVLETAARELREETAHEAGSLEVLATVFLSPGFTDEVTTFVLAMDCVPITFTQDPDEPMQLARVPLGRIPELLEPGNCVITQAQAMIGLLWLMRLRDLR